MSILQRLERPVLAAPMAGGPSTPQLAQAVARGGGLGFLAGGTISAEQLTRDMTTVAGDYAVNLFAPQEPLSDLTDVYRVMAELSPAYREHGLAEPELPRVNYDNGWGEKLAAILDAPHPPVAVSATFGCFTAREVAALQERDIEAWVTVTTPADARTAAGRGVDALVVQGPAAGGHRSTWGIHEQPDQRPLSELVADVAAVVPGELALIPAGGVTTAAEVRRVLEWPQVRAVSCGTAFLRATEAGTSEANRGILAAAGEDATVVTRAFSGRFARGVATAHTAGHPDTPAVYPFLNPLLKPLRSDPDFAYCLAGTGAHRARAADAADILSDLAP